MRNPARIWPLVQKIYTLWTLMPDCRLGQLLSYICRFPPENDSGYLTSTTHLLLEDHIWDKYLDEAIDKLKEEDYNREQLEREYTCES
jgi:hypothetical protein